MAPRFSILHTSVNSFDVLTHSFAYVKPFQFQIIYVISTSWIIPCGENWLLPRSEARHRLSKPVTRHAQPKFRIQLLIAFYKLVKGYVNAGEFLRFTNHFTH